MPSRSQKQWLQTFRPLQHLSGSDDTGAPCRGARIEQVGRACRCSHPCSAQSRLLRYPCTVLWLQSQSRRVARSRGDDLEFSDITATALALRSLKLYGSRILHRR